VIQTEIEAWQTSFESTREAKQTNIRVMSCSLDSCNERLHGKQDDGLNVLTVHRMDSE
jgi:hypothetical protein